MLFFWAWRHVVMLKNQCTDESLRNMVFCSVIHKTPPKTNLSGLTSQSWRCKKDLTVHVYLFHFSSVLLLSVFHGVWVFAPALLCSAPLNCADTSSCRKRESGSCRSGAQWPLQASGTGFNFYSVEWQSMVASRGNQVAYALAPFSPCQLFPSPSHVPLKYNTEISSSPCTADSQRLHTKYIAFVYLCVLVHTR